MNLVEIAGHLGADPETRVTPNGLKITNLKVATNARKAGKDETIWWRVTVFGDRFDKMLMHFKKGSAIIVLGDLNKPEIWTDKDGNPQVSLEIVAELIKFSPFGKSERSQEGGGQHGQSYGNNQNSQYGQSSSGYGQEAAPKPGSYSGHQSTGNQYDDEEIPF